MLMLSTLRHFGYGNYDCVVKNGTHCKYVKEIDEDSFIKINALKNDIRAEE